MSAHEKGREATNAANRKKTEFRNGVKNYWTAEQLPIGSFIRAGGFEFRYEATETTSLDEEAIFKLYEDGEITREQLLRMIKIDAKEAKNILGADQVADLEVKSVGDKLDIRMESLPVEQAEEEFVAVRRLVRKKVKRSVFGKEREARKQPVAETKPGRKIKIGRKK